MAGHRCRQGQIPVDIRRIYLMTLAALPGCRMKSSTIQNLLVPHHRTGSVLALTSPFLSLALDAAATGILSGHVIELKEANW